MPQNTVALIPAYHPDENLVSVVNSLKAEGFCRILIVDDGNPPEYSRFFDPVAADPQVTVLHHSVNLGKGRALKTAFDHILKTWPGQAAVCVDCDGQLSASDAARGALLAQKHPDSLILGCRNLRQTKNVPFASRFGNGLTRFTVAALTGIRFSDTQCGLRAYPPDVMKQLLPVAGDRFEFENNTLTEVCKRHIPVVEYPIDVVYGEKEAYSTTFRRVRDSILIYKNLLSFINPPTVSFLTASVLCLLICSGVNAPLLSGLVWALCTMLSSALCTLVSARTAPLLFSGAVLSVALGLAAAGLFSLGLGSTAVWLCLFAPTFLGLCFIYRRFGFGRRPKPLRYSR